MTRQGVSAQCIVLAANSLPYSNGLQRGHHDSQLTEERLVGLNVAGLQHKGHRIYCQQEVPHQKRNSQYESPGEDLPEAFSNKQNAEAKTLNYKPSE